MLYLFPLILSRLLYAPQSIELNNFLKLITDNQPLITEEFGKVSECDNAIDGEGFGPESHDHGKES